MTEDIFDVVDEQDQVIGQAPRSEVHAKKWLHRAVHVLVFNQKGELFIQKRALTKDSHPGCWDSSCSGHVDAGEDYTWAAVRELKEELGLDDLPALDLLECIPASSATDYEFIRVFRLNHEGPFELNSLEITEGRFLSGAELDADIRQNPQSFATAFKTIIEKIHKKIF